MRQTYIGQYSDLQVVKRLSNTEMHMLYSKSIRDNIMDPILECLEDIPHADAIPHKYGHKLEMEKLQDNLSLFGFFSDPIMLSILILTCAFVLLSTSFQAKKCLQK